MDIHLDNHLNQAELLAVAKKELDRRSKIAAGRTGKKHSEETKAKMRQTQQKRLAMRKKSEGVSTKTGLEAKSVDAMKHNTLETIFTPMFNYITSK